MFDYGQGDHHDKRTNPTRTPAPVRKSNPPFASNHDANHSSSSLVESTSTRYKYPIAVPVASATRRNAPIPFVPGAGAGTSNATNGSALASSCRIVGARNVPVIIPGPTPRKAPAPLVSDNTALCQRQRQRQQHDSNVQTFQTNPSTLSSSSTISIPIPIPERTTTVPNAHSYSDSTNVNNPYNKAATIPSKAPQTKTVRWKEEEEKEPPHPLLSFLIMAMRNAKNEYSQRPSSSLSSLKSCRQLVRIQGIVTTDPFITTYKDQKHGVRTAAEETLAFMFDDGTATIDALYTTTPMKCIPGLDPQNYEMAKHKLLTLLSLPPLRKIALGDRVDCTGYIQYVRSNSNSSQESIAKKRKLTPCFMVELVSFVSDPNLEALRIAQITRVKPKTVQDCTTLGNSTQPRPRPCKETVFVYGNPGRKPSPIIYETKRVYVDPVRLFHLINLSPPTGLTLNDLEMLFHLDTVQQSCALRNGLKMLQTNYEIYVSRTGAYLPL